MKLCKTTIGLIFASIVLIASIFGMAHTVHAQMTDIDQVRGYIEKYKFDRVPSQADNEDYATYLTLQDWLKEKDLDERNPQELNSWLEDREQYNEFVDQFSDYLREEFTSDEYNPQPLPEHMQPPATPSNDPTKEGFQLAPVECQGGVGINRGKNYGDCGWLDLIALFNTVIQFMVYIAASLSALAFAYAGFLYMTAFGNSGKIEQAHGIFKKTIVGILFVLLGWLLVYTILLAFGVNITDFSLLKKI